MRIQTTLCYLLLLLTSIGTNCAIAAPQTTELTLAEKQTILLESVDRLEKKLLSLADFESERNTERSELLKKGLSFSQSKEILVRIRSSANLLRNGRINDLKKSAELQRGIVADLESLYSILQSTDPQKLNRDRQQKLRKRIHRLTQLIQKQQNVRDNSEFTEDLDKLKKTQVDVKQATIDLKKEIESETPELNSDDAINNQGKTGPPQPDPESTKIAAKNSTETPNQKIVNRLSNADREMKNSLDKIDEKELNDARKNMEKAESELAYAKKQLEKILQQERESEIESTLRSMEERFDELLKRQLVVNEKTQQLVESKNPKSEIDIESFQLSTTQRKNILTIDKLLLMLNEEGSSRAIPGTLRHLRDDMSEVVVRLEESRLDPITTTIQTEIAEALADLIESVRQERKQDESRSKQANNSAEGPADFKKPLVQQLAELKIVRQLQMKINSRHKLYAKQYENASDLKKKDISRLTLELSKKQLALEQITFDLIEAAQ